MNRAPSSFRTMAKGSFWKLAEEHGAAGMGSAAASCLTEGERQLFHGLLPESRQTAIGPKAVVGAIDGWRLLSTAWTEQRAKNGQGAPGSEIVLTKQLIRLAPMACVRNSRLHW